MQLLKEMIYTLLEHMKLIVKKDILGNKEDNIELGKKLAQKILMGQ